MKLDRKWVVTAAAAILAVGAGVGVMAASAVDDGEPPITGDALTRATEAALGHTGGGVVTGTEVGDEDSYYEVEVTLGDGSQVDVQLDGDFNVVSADADGQGDED